MITRHITELLLDHECVIVPGLGGFLKSYSPASIHPTTHEFSPPSGCVAFNAGLSGNDGILANYIASVKNITYREAISEVKQWVQACNLTIQNGEKISLSGIGELQMNSSGRIEFVPSNQINFNPDSFGLPVFIAKTVDQGSFKLTEVQSIKQSKKSSQLRRLVPETLKWAAVLAPFIAFVLWGTMNGNVIDNYVHNYTGMLSWVRSTPGKTVPAKMITPERLSIKAIISDNVQPYLKEISDKKMAINPGIASYAEMAKYDIYITEKQHIETIPTAVSEKVYHVIGGAFRDQDNAIKLISILEKQGYPACIVDTTPSGLFVVSMKGFDNYNEAITKLGEIKKNGFAASWILKKNKG